MAAFVRDKQNYFTLLSLLAAVEAKAATNGIVVDLINVKVDEENSVEYAGKHNYWDMMYTSASMAAGMRGEEAGIDINKIAGCIIY